MIPNNSQKMGRNTSSFYKPPNTRNMSIMQWIWYYARSLVLWTWNQGRRWGWIVSSGFVILVLPTLMLQMLSDDASLMKDFEP